jgi:hypothetical protein
VCGSAAAQAIQLRMRAGGQNLVGGASLVAHDATGANPITLLTFPSSVANAAAGARILVASAPFTADNGPTPDFTLTNLIPESYLAAGRLTFQSGSIIYWSLSWGGAGYTGSNSGATTAQDGNDADGNFGPPFAGPLPSAGAEALRFQGLASALSTNNAADYAVTSGGAAFTNNAGASGATLSCPVFTDGFESSDFSAWSRKEP